MCKGKGEDGRNEKLVEETVLRKARKDVISKECIFTF